MVLPLVSVDELLGRLQLGAQATEKARESCGCGLPAVASKNQELAHLLPRLLDVVTRGGGITSELSVGCDEGLKVGRRVGIKSGNARGEAGGSRATLTGAARLDTDLGLNHGKASQNLV